MSYHPDDTICAIGSAAGGGARGMIRISGPNAAAVADSVFEADDKCPLNCIRLPIALAGQMRFLASRDMRYHHRSNAAGAHSSQRKEGRVPADLFLWPTERSYTREPVAELHTFGSPPILQAALANICEAGARLAEPGEFTLRAFLGGRLDLTQAEAVLGVIDAAEATELHAALTQLAGGLARPLVQLRDDLLQLLADLEAGLDFVEEDIRFVSPTDVLRRLQAAASLLNDVARQIESRHVATENLEVALVGPPNAGKSSLFNALVERYATGPANAKLAVPAIVSPTRGTTRDYLAATISVDAMRIKLVDTAGVEDNPNSSATTIDAKAQSFATEQREQASVRAFCIDATDLENAHVSPTCDLIVVTKSDLQNVRADRIGFALTLPVVVTSSHTGDGLFEFCNEIRKLLAICPQPRRQTVVAMTAERCHESIRLSTTALNTAADLVKSNAGDEIVAAELRVALAELGKVVGAVYTDDLLDRIFKTFCIGK